MQLKPLVFITGASGGIGQALALRYAQAGYRLALLARRLSLIQEWAALQGLGPEHCQCYAADVRQTASILQAAQTCLAHQGLPDVVIANAGISVGMDSSQAEDLGTLADILATNNLGLAASFQPFITPMIRRGHGRLVGIASVAGIRGLPGHAAYCASKAAVISYCESLRVELRHTGVGVTTLCPGYVDTPMTQANRYSMPFLMDAQQFADQAYRAIGAGSSYKVIPWQMAWVAKLLRWLPNPVFDAIVSGRGRKSRRMDH